MQSRNHSYWYYAEYSTFRVLSEADNYKLKVGGYSGNAGYDAMAYANDRMFTTYDRDNDLTVKKTAQRTMVADSGTRHVPIVQSTVSASTALIWMEVATLAHCSPVASASSAEHRRRYKGFKGSMDPL